MTRLPYCRINTEIGKIILAACFVNDLGAVLALGVVFARYDLWLLLFGAVTAVVLVVLARYADQTQYTILVTAVIGSAVVPTMIAQAWFQPEFKAIADEPEVVEAEDAAREEP